MLKAYFARKPMNLREYNEMIEDAKEGGYYQEEEVNPIARIKVSEDEFHDFWNHFLHDRDWLKPYANRACGNDCVVVDCGHCNSAILVICEGYNYGRYIAIVNQPVEF